MRSAAPPLAPEALVRRLLAEDDAGNRRDLIAQCDLDADGARTVIRRLLDEAERLISVDPVRMERICRDALALAEQARDDYLWALARFWHGDALALQDRNTEACICLDEARAVFTRLGNPVEAARTRIIWVWATGKLGGDADALAVARAARRVLATYGETLLLGKLYQNIGIIHAMRGRHRAALRSFTAALSLFMSVGDTGRDDAARARHNRGAALIRLGRYREAAKELELATEAHRKLGQTALEAGTVLSLGETQMSLGRYAAALREFEAVLPVFRSLGLYAPAIWAARDAADCYLHLNRPSDALAVLADADSDLHRVDNASDVFANTIRRAAAYLLLDQGEAALAALDEADRQFSVGDIHERASLEAQRTAALLRTGAPTPAVQSARRATELARASGMRRLAADALLTEGAALLELGAIDAAERVIARARRTAAALDAAPLLHRAFELQGRIAEATGRLTAAHRAYSAAVEQLERDQRGVIFEFRDSFAAGRGAAYERLATLQLQADRPTDALATAERAKSRALADAIAGTVELRPRGSAAARAITRELTAAREDYAAAASQVSRTRVAANDDTGARSEAARRMAELETRIHVLVRRLQLAEAGAAIADLYGAAPDPALPSLPADTALVEFFFSGDDILRFLVRERNVQATMLTGAVPEVERLMRAFRLNLDSTERSTKEHRNRLAGQARALLGRLYNQLLGGADSLADCRSLVIVPHGLLHYLPFHALHDGDGYLIERFAVSYAPSAALYGVCRARERRPFAARGALVVAHSAGGELPFVLDEAAAVSGVLGAPVYQEEDATRALLQTAGRRAGVIHIAAHGRFRPDAPLFSTIELADGPLTTVDVFSLDLRAALVTLSACETGRAVLGGGDELIGLGRAFLYAGAAGLLVSQWRVDDAATGALMARFYQEYTRQGTAVGRAEALRRAQISRIRDQGPAGTGGPHPFYWAGFQIIGAG